MSSTSSLNTPCTARTSASAPWAPLRHIAPHAVPVMQAYSCSSSSSSSSSSATVTASRTPAEELFASALCFAKHAKQRLEAESPCVYARFLELLALHTRGAACKAGAGTGAGAAAAAAAEEERAAAASICEMLVAYPDLQRAFERFEPEAGASCVGGIAAATATQRKLCWDDCF